MEIKLEKNEKIEDLQCKGLKIIQNKDLYCFTSDSVILANFISLKKKDKALEIGMGSGVISILLSAKTNFDKISGFELQEEMFKLCQKNIALNDLLEKLNVINDDARNYKKYFETGAFDVVFSNPPYMVGGNGNDCRDKARHEKSLPLKDLICVASTALKFGGKFYLVYTASRTAEVIFELVNAGLEPKTMFFTENGKGKVVLVVIEAVKGGKHGVKILPTLVTNDRDGSYIEKLHTKYVK